MCGSQCSKNEDFIFGEQIYFYLLEKVKVLENRHIELKNTL